MKIDFVAMPTMIDGKTRLIWSDGTKATTCCPVCAASPYNTMKARYPDLAPHNCTTNILRLAFGFSPLHCRMHLFGK